MTETKYRLVREEPGLFRVFYRAHGRLYCLRNDGGFGRKALTFYQCRNGEPRYALAFIPGEDEFDNYIEP
jgi:hypothetical protein